MRDERTGGSMICMLCLAEWKTSQSEKYVRLRDHFAGVTDDDAACVDCVGSAAKS